MTIEPEISYRTGINTPLFLLKFVDQLHRTDLGRSRYGSCWKGGPHHIVSAVTRIKFSNNIRDDVHDVTVSLDSHEFCHLDGAVFGYPPDVVPGQVDKHEMLRTFFRISQQFFSQTLVFFAGTASLPGPCDGTNLDLFSPQPHMDFR